MGTKETSCRTSNRDTSLSLILNYYFPQMKYLLFANTVPVFSMTYVCMTLLALYIKKMNAADLI